MVSVGSVGPAVVWLAATAFVVAGLTVSVASGNADEPAPPVGAPSAVSLNAALTAFTTAHGYFLKVPGILGESVEAAHENEIDVRTVSWGVTNATGTTVTGAKVRMFKQTAEQANGFAETVGFSYTSMRLTYRRQNPDGSTTSVTGCWNLATHVAC
ncbi:MAG: Type secretion system effector, Hcp [Actinomycetota bacterium]|nr:Type secretion system effector, Hcp [Actinomycetota bacterium]